MKLWIGGEVDSDVFEAYRLALLSVEDFINPRITHIEANEANELDVIAIIRDDDFKERIRFSKKNGMDLRLIIPYKEFLSANSHQQKELVVAMLERSIDIVTEKFPKALDVRLVRQVLAEARSHA
ncbi:Imm44 family immunity protein [Microbulbifer aggregans]|uniref:Imm44 family immunity protein n=1 Tax=Microbulbifer aggregans TaxID=1769779 RepID=UPI001CFC7355|nr:Imm44 family immunity protein [Microbulbifer aggregans]